MYFQEKNFRWRRGSAILSLQRHFNDWRKKKRKSIGTLLLLTGFETTSVSVLTTTFSGAIGFLSIGYFIFLQFPVWRGKS